MRNIKSAEDRRHEILDTAEELFAYQGYENTSVQQILNRIGIAKGTFYYHFKSKEEVMDRVERRIIKKLYNAYRNGDFGILKLIELKNTAIRLGNIGDRAEDASDRVLIIVAKRRG